eukprot:12172169-Alexandrium_andersonii.AAC.1
MRKVCMVVRMGPHASNARCGEYLNKVVRGAMQSLTNCKHIGHVMFANAFPQHLLTMAMAIAS